MKIVKALKEMLGFTRHPVQWAEERISRAQTCPECGHGGEGSPELTAFVAEGCVCSDDYCACNPELVDHEGADY